jgi:hypothetical protein
MASKVDICNLALSHLAQGATPITSISPPDGSFYADVMFQYYSIARDMALEAHEWTFATTRERLSRIALPEQITQWSYAFDFPTGVIRPLVVLPYENTSDLQALPFRLEVDALTDERMVLCNVDDATMKYIRRQDDTTRYTPSFVMCLSYLLAHFAAGPITKKQSVVDGMFKLYRTHLDLARGLNAQSTDESAYKDHLPASMAARGIATRGRQGPQQPLPDGFIIRG